MARVSVRLGRWSFRGSLKFVRVSFQTTSDTPLLTFVSVSILHLCSLLVAGRLLRLPLDCVKPYEAGKIACAPFPCPGRCLRLYMRFPLAFVALSGSGASLFLSAGSRGSDRPSHPPSSDFLPLVWRAAGGRAAAIGTRLYRLAEGVACHPMRCLPPRVAPVSWLVT